MASGGYTTMEHNWYALSVKSRHEFIARDELQKKGIATFLPSAIRLRQWRDRKKNVEFPVFPGYLFVYIEPRPEEFQRVIKTRGTVHLISLEPGHPTPVVPEEIQSLRSVIQSGQAFDVYPQFQEGTRVRIRRGPLQGTEGVLANKEEERLFFVNIEILGRSVGLKICPDDIEQA
jgi:transcription termination/antitermination protein NusG